MSASQHKLPGEHTYNDVVFPGIIPDDILDRLKQTVFDDLDVIVVAYPKTGTTLLQEIVYLIHTGGDFETSDKVLIRQRYPYLEVKIAGKSSLDKALEMAQPRLMKSHLMANFFNRTLKKSKTKFVVIMRNPKDMLVSYYHFYRINKALNLFPGTWDEFFNIFQERQLMYGDYFDHVNSWWDLQDNPNILIVKYEDILVNPHQIIRQIASHLDKEISDDLVAKIAERTTFKNMKNIASLNYSDHPAIRNDISPFMRKGEVGDWRNYFNEEQNKIVDNLYKKRCVNKGLTFDFVGESSKL